MTMTMIAISNHHIVYVDDSSHDSSLNDYTAGDDLYDTAGVETENEKSDEPADNESVADHAGVDHDEDDEDVIVDIDVEDGNPDDDTVDREREDRGPRWTKKMNYIDMSTSSHLKTVGNISLLTDATMVNRAMTGYTNGIHAITTYNKTKNSMG